MKRRILPLLALLALTISCKSKAVSQVSPKTYYTYDTQGELGSCTLYADRIVFKSPMNSESEKSTNVVNIEKRLDGKHLILHNKQSGQPYGVVSVYTTDQDVLKMNILFSATSLEEVERKWEQESAPAWSPLRERDLYPKVMIDRLEKAPGLDEIKREDLITAMQWRKPLSGMLQQFLEDNEGQRRFMVYRFVEQYRNRKLIELGYNPYKQVVYNLQKQFEGDEEIQKLLNEEIKF